MKSKSLVDCNKYKCRGADKNHELGYLVSVATDVNSKFVVSFCDSTSTEFGSDPGESLSTQF